MVKSAYRRTYNSGVLLFIETLTAIEMALDSRLASLGVTLADYEVLLALCEYGPLTQIDIAARLNRAISSLTSQLHRLERRGLICRSAHPLDKRSRVLSLEASGAQLVEACFGVMQAASKELFGGLGQEQVQEMTEAIGRRVLKRPA